MEEKEKIKDAQVISEDNKTPSDNKTKNSTTKDIPIGEKQ